MGDVVWKPFQEEKARSRARDEALNQMQGIENIGQLPTDVRDGLHAKKSRVKEADAGVPVFPVVDIIGSDSSIGSFPETTTRCARSVCSLQDWIGARKDTAYQQSQVRTKVAQDKRMWMASSSRYQ